MYAEALEANLAGRDHDANVRPWIVWRKPWEPLSGSPTSNPETTELDPSEIDQVISPATKLVAVTAASNILGTIPDVATIANIVHGVGALLFVDGVHLAAHASVDVTELGADFFACSPYKFLGPHCGALWGRPEIPEGLSPDKLLPSADRVSERFELGTLPYELLAGTTAAINFSLILRLVQKSER